MSVCTAAFFTTTEGWKQPQRPPTDERAHTTWDSHTTEYHRASKSTDTLSYATPWGNLTSCSVKQASRKKTNTVGVHLEGSRVVKLTETESRLVTARGWGEDKRAVSRARNFGFLRCGTMWIQLTLSYCPLKGG